MTSNFYHRCFASSSAEGKGSTATTVNSTTTTEGRRKRRRTNMKLDIITGRPSQLHCLIQLVLLLVSLFIDDVAVVRANEDACNCGLFQSHTTCRHVSGCSWLNNKCRGTCYNSNQRDVDCNVLQNYCVGPPTESSVCEHRLDMFQQRQQQQSNNNNDEEGLFSTGLQQGEVEESDNDVLTVSSTSAPDPKSMCEWNDWFCQYSSEQNKCQLYPQACNDVSSFGQAQLLSLEEDECLMLGCTWLTNQPHPTCSDDRVKGNLTTTTNNKDAFEQESESKQNKGMSKMITSAAITGIICFIFIGLCWSSVVFCRNGPSQHEIEEEAEAAHHHHEEEDQKSPNKKYNTDGDEVEEGLDLSENSPRHFPLEQDFNIDFDPAQLVQQTKRPSRAERSTSYGESIAATTLSCDVPIRKHRLPYSIPGIPRET